MANSITTIKASLKTLLLAVKDESTPTPLNLIQQALTYEPRVLDQYDTAGIFTAGETVENETMANYLAHYNFIISVFIFMYDEKVVQDRQDNLVYYLTKALEADKDLSGSVDMITINGVDNDWVGGESDQSVWARTRFNITVDKEETK